MNSQWDALEKILLCQSSAANTNTSVPKHNGNFKLHKKASSLLFSELNYDLRHIWKPDTSPRILIL